MLLLLRIEIAHQQGMELNATLVKMCLDDTFLNYKEMVACDCDGPGQGNHLSQWPKLATKRKKNFGKNLTTPLKSLRKRLMEKRCYLRGCNDSSG